MKNFEVTFTQNVKLGAIPYRKGEKATVFEDELETLKDVIEADYESVESESKTIEDMTVAELKQYASENEIDLGDAKKRDDILTAIQSAEIEKDLLE